MSGVLDWPWSHVQELLRLYGPDIGQLAQRGDALACKVRARYQYAFDHPNDIEPNRSLRDALNEYLQRDLMDAEQADLGSRFGHRVDESTTSH